MVERTDGVGGMAEAAEQKFRKPHPIEWIVGGVCGVLVLAMIGYILYEAIRVTSSLPELSVMADNVKPTGGGFRVEFRAINDGDATAASVKVEGQLMSGDRIVETSDVTLDYVPLHSEQKGGLIFRNDPRQHRLEVQVKGYMEP